MGEYVVVYVPARRVGIQLDFSKSDGTVHAIFPESTRAESAKCTPEPKENGTEGLATAFQSESYEASVSR